MRNWIGNEPWREECRFWLPDDDHVSYGWLDYAPDRGVEAHIMDTPLADREDSDEEEQIEAIFGETLGRLPFSLLHVWRLNTRWPGGGSLDVQSGNIVDFAAGYVVRRAHVRSLEEILVKRGAPEVSGLWEFLSGGTVDKGLLPVPPGPNAYDDFSVPLERAELHLAVWANERHGARLTSAELQAGASFEPAEPMPLPEFSERYSDPFRDLVAFATDEPTFTYGLRAWIPDAEPESPVSYSGLEIVHRRYPPIEPPAQSSYSYYSLMLNPATVPDPRRTIAAWFRLREQLGPVWPFLFATLHRPDLPLENQLLNLAAFGEGYHRTLHDRPQLSDVAHKQARKAMLSGLDNAHERDVYNKALRYANLQTQRQRVRWLTNRALDVLDAWDLDAKTFTDELVDTRNWLVHWGKRGPNAQEHEGMAVLRIRFEHILRINLLLELGLDEDSAAEQFASGMRLRRLL